MLFFFYTDAIAIITVTGIGSSVILVHHDKR